jgi:hypothetical protein
LRQLAAQLTALGHPVSHTLVGELLRKMGYSLQANQKTKEGATHPDRNAQFKFINARTKKELAAGNPVISVDTKKKELVGDFKNPKATPRKYACTTSASLNWGVQTPMEFMIWPTTWAG